MTTLIPSVVETAILGDGLSAISHELHTTQTSESSSLNNWLQWLDDQGYDREAFVESLQGLCRAHLDGQSYAQLEAEATARSDQPDGMQQAINYFNDFHPALLEQILEIEQTRQQELLVLNATAGGVNMKKVGVDTLATVVIGGAVTVRKDDVSAAD